MLSFDQVYFLTRENNSRLIFSKTKAIFCCRSDKCEMLRVQLNRPLSSTCKYYNGLFFMFLKVLAKQKLKKCLRDDPISMKLKENFPL